MVKDLSIMPGTIKLLKEGMWESWMGVISKLLKQWTQARLGLQPTAFLQSQRTGHRAETFKSYVFKFLFVCLFTLSIRAFVSLCVCSPLACLVSVEPWRGQQIPWNCSYRWLRATICMLGTKPGSSARATGVLNFRAITPASTNQCFW